MSVDQLNQTTPGSTNFDDLVAAVDKNAKGLNQITLSNYDNDSAPVVKVGSVFENNGSTFIVTSSDITPTGYSSMTVSTTFYLYYDESASTFIYSNTAPTWNDALQGWYNGNDRALFSMYKDSGGTLYQSKALMHNKSSLYFNDQVRYKKYYKATTPTADAIFEILKDWVPTTGDLLSCVGHYSVSVITGIYRFSATRIYIQGINIATNALSSATIDDGGGVVASIEIMSNFDFVT